MQVPHASSLVAAAAAAVIVLGPAAPARADTPGPAVPTGNVVFIHPDGTGPSHWGAARMYWYGPDAISPWDRLPHVALYRGHMADDLVATSNGGATTHAFGYKVAAAGSYGMDGRGPAARPILALSGYPGSLLREAANAGHPTGVVNDGDLPEPGTGVFFAEVDDRDESSEIARQLLDGRPGFGDRDQAPVVALGGGEGFFLPKGTLPCTGEVKPDCAVHVDSLKGSGPARDDGRNLVREALARGWQVLRTRAEFEAFRARLAREADWRPRVLGLFARDDIFNDAPEEALLASGLVDATRAPGDRRGRLISHGSLPGSLGYDPPTAAEMTVVALEVLSRWSRAAGKPFLLVTEVESTDNMSNSNNAIGTLAGLAHANGAIEAALAHLARDPATLVLAAADSDASGLQVIGVDAPRARSENVNPAATRDQDVKVPLDGIEGRDSASFVAEPDQFGQRLAFNVGWASGRDLAGGVVTRAAGLHAERLASAHAARFDNLDVYRLAYLTLFGRHLDYPQGRRAPGRD